MVHYVPPDTGRTHHTCDIAIPNDNLNREETSDNSKLRHILQNTWTLFIRNIRIMKHREKNFPGGTVDGNPSANAGDAGSIPGPGVTHMPWSNWAQVPQLLNLCPRACGLRLLSSYAATTEARMPRACILQQEKLLQGETQTPQPRTAPLAQLKKSPCTRQGRPASSKVF